MQKENEDIIIAILAGSFFILLFGSATFFIVVNSVKRKKQMIHEKEIQAEQFRRQILEAQLEMQEHTFRIVSQEIHDNVGQILSLAKLNLNIVTYQQKETEAYQTIKELVATAITELRDLGTGYYADKLAAEGLVSAIRHLVNQISKTRLFMVSFKSEFERLALDKDKIIFLYRMVQESLNNIVKHSSAIHVDVSIYRQKEHIYISIKDDGRGFENTLSDTKKGIGLSSLRNRASMIDAEVQINSQINKGTVVTLVFKGA
ncbi:MAG: ATP-binding protein [Bacteroidota bacterium]